MCNNCKTAEPIKFTASVQVREMSRKELWTRTGKKMTRVYFSHSGETILENFGNRVARPKTLYREYLPEIAKLLGCDVKDFRWSSYAGCSMCPCSPGFIARAGKRGLNIWVTLSEAAPRTNGDAKDEVHAHNRIVQLIAQL